MSIEAIVRSIVREEPERVSARLLDELLMRVEAVVTTSAPVEPVGDVWLRVPAAAQRGSGGTWRTRVDTWVAGKQCEHESRPAPLISLTSRRGR